MVRSVTIVTVDRSIFSFIRNFYQVRIVEGRDLPVMDSRSELTDAYVEVKFGDENFRTPVCRRTLCPVWNADFRFEVEDNEIQDEILEIRYGKVYVMYKDICTTGLNLYYMNGLLLLHIECTIMIRLVPMIRLAKYTSL